MKFNIKTFLNYKFWEKFILFTSAIGAPFLTQGMIVDINSSGKEIWVYGWLTNSLIYLLMLSVSFYVFWIIQFVLLTIYNVIYYVFFNYIRIFISYCKSQGIKGILSKINCFFNAYSKWILLVTTIFGLVVLYFNNALPIIIVKFIEYIFLGFSAIIGIVFVFGMIKTLGITSLIIINGLARLIFSFLTLIFGTIIKIYRIVVKKK